MSVANGKFTPTQRRILAVLADGDAHTPEELLKCLDDELATKPNLRVHLSLIRRHLRPAGQDILCVYVGRDYLYRHVRLINRNE